RAPLRPRKRRSHLHFRRGPAHVAPPRRRASLAGERLWAWRHRGWAAKPALALQLHFGYGSIRTTPMSASLVRIALLQFVTVIVSVFIAGSALKMRFGSGSHYPFLATYVRD